MSKVGFLQMSGAARWLVAALAAVLYGLAFVLPSCSFPFRTRFVRNTFTGAEAFELGWRVLIAWEPADRTWWVLSAAWLANPAIWAALLAAAWGRWRIAMIAAAYAFAGCLLPLAVLHFRRIVCYPGFCLWFQSATLLLAASVLALLQSRHTAIKKTARPCGPA